MCFCFLGANAAGDAAVCDFAILWHLKFGDEVYGVSAFWHSSADSLGEASEFIGERLDPFLFVGSFDEMSVFLCLACDGVGDGVGGVLDWYNIGDQVWGWLLRSELIAVSVLYWVVVVGLNDVGAVWCQMRVSLRGAGCRVWELRHPRSCCDIC